MRKWRVDSLLWMAGTLCAVFGMLILVTPQQLNFQSVEGITFFQMGLGTGMLISGFVLLGIVVFHPPKWFEAAAALFAGLLMLAFSYQLVLIGAIITSLLVASTAVGVLLAPLLSAPRPVELQPSRSSLPNLYPVTTGLGYMLSGLYLLSPFFQGSTPHYNLSPDSTILLGIGLAASGAWVAVSEARPGLKGRVAVLALLVLGFFMLLNAAPERRWAPIIFYIVTAFGLLALPILVSRPGRPVSSSLRSRLALVLAFFATFPLVMGIAMEVSELGFFRSIQPGSELALLVLIAMLVLTMALGFFLTRLLTVPLQNLAAAMERFSASRSDEPLPESQVAELRQLSNAFTEMRDRLNRERARREQAQEELKRANEILEDRVAERSIELEAAHRTLQAVLQALPVGVRITDSNGLVIQVNQMMKDVWGKDDPERVADATWTPVAWWGSTNQPLKPSDWPLARSLRKGEVSPGEIIDIQRKDGQRATILSGSAPVVDPAGKFMGAVEFALDITRVTQLEHQVLAAIREARRKAIETEGVFNALSDAVIAFGTDGTVRLANSYAIAMFGFDPLHHNRQTVAERLAPRDPKGIALTAEEMPSYRAFKGEFLVNQRLEFTNRRGRTYTALVTASPVIIRGEITGVVEIWHDITQQERLLEQLSLEQSQLKTLADRLERSNQDLEQFAYVASHDLQEPLRKVNFFGERLKDMLSTQLSEQEVEYIERMLNASRRMQGMIQDLLTFSRVHTKAQPFTQVDLNEVAGEVLSDLEIAILRSRGQVEVGGLAVIEADEMQMHQLLQNLISNALKFHIPGESPRVEISCTQATLPEGRPGIELRVRDYGIGFDMKHLDRIFQPFERLNGRNEFEGSGMGLAICFKITDRHHGEISAESRPGEGATFYVRLPINQPEEEKEE